MTKENPIPGFYDDVLALSDQEREQFEALAFDEENFKIQIGVEAVSGEIGYSTLERNGRGRPLISMACGAATRERQRPCCRLGRGQIQFQIGAGTKPRENCRVARVVLREHLPPGIEMEFLEMHHAPGVVVPLDSPYLSAASQLKRALAAVCSGRDRFLS